MEVSNIEWKFAYPIEFQWMALVVYVKLYRRVESQCMQYFNNAVTKQMVHGFVFVQSRRADVANAKYYV